MYESPKQTSAKSEVLRSRDQIAAQVEDALAEELGERSEAVIALLSSLTQTETVVQGYCEECGGTARVRYPDWKGIKALLELWFNYVLGKPRQRVEKRTETESQVHVTVEDMRALPDEELAKIVARQPLELPSGK